MIKGTDCLCFLGDSITEGVGTAKRYIDYIAEETGAEVHGYGVNGAQSVDLFAQIGRMQKETDGCFDILFVCIGTNDYNAGVPLGEFFTEAAETVVCGYFDSYVNAVRQAADIWAVELIDLYRESGLFPLNDKHAEMYFNKSSEDSLHPNAAGHDKIARAILRRI